MSGNNFRTFFLPISNENYKPYPVKIINNKKGIHREPKKLACGVNPKFTHERIYNTETILAI